MLRNGKMVVLSTRWITWLALLVVVILHQFGNDCKKLNTVSTKLAVCSKHTRNAVN